LGCAHRIALNLKVEGGHSPAYNKDINNLDGTRLKKANGLPNGQGEQYPATLVEYCLSPARGQLTGSACRVSARRVGSQLKAKPEERSAKPEARGRWSKKGFTAL